MELNWEKLLSKERLSETKKETKQTDIRSEYQRDYDRILFCSPFRRMQDKTQVFPIPKSDFVHNRLTHSIEVSSVGRSLGLLAGKFIIEEKGLKEFSAQDIGEIVASACMAHDIGNPPFGHSGEKAISSFFTSNTFKKLNFPVTDDIKNDLIKFEGNAAGFRILTNDHPSGINGGLRLTYATLGTFTKYPWESKAIINEGAMNSFCKKDKFGFFTTEKQIFKKVAQELGLMRLSEDPLIYCRHPLSFLMEAADTICYRAIDIEDAHKLGLISFDDASKNLRSIIKKSEGNSDYNDKKYKNISKKDEGEAIGYLRAKAIHVLIYQAIEVFKNRYDEIMTGKYNTELMHEAESKTELDNIKNLLENSVFNNRAVLQLELAGFEVMGELINLFAAACLDSGHSKSKKLLSLLPTQFKSTDLKDSKQLLLIAEFVSRMTDSYAVDFYKKIKGTSLAEL